MRQWHLCQEHYDTLKRDYQKSDQPSKQSEYRVGIAHLLMYRVLSPSRDAFTLNLF